MFSSDKISFQGDGYYGPAARRSILKEAKIEIEMEDVRDTRDRLQTFNKVGCNCQMSCGRHCSCVKEEIPCQVLVFSLLIDKWRSK